VSQSSKVYVAEGMLEYMPINERKRAQMIQLWGGARDHTSKRESGPARPGLGYMGSEHVKALGGGKKLWLTGTFQAPEL